MGPDLDLIRTSFELVRPKGNELMDVFYATLFERYPQVEPLFADTDMDAQKGKLLRALALVVASIDRPGTLTETLQSMGARHVDYGVKPEHYDAVGECLLHALATVAGDAWDERLEQAWGEAYRMVSALMLRGADNKEPVVTISTG
ncbi:MAG: globin family protein [Polyangiales bacterium]